MIRVKHDIYPVWFQWEGDESNFNNAKTAILEDVRLNGFDHFTAYEDITDEVTENQEYWDKDDKPVTKESKPIKLKTTVDTTDKPRKKSRKQPHNKPMSKLKPDVARTIEAAFPAYGQKVAAEPVEPTEIVELTNDKQRNKLKSKVN